MFQSDTYRAKMDDVMRRRLACVEACKAVLEEIPDVLGHLSRRGTVRFTPKYIDSQVNLDGRVATVFMRHWYLYYGAPLSVRMSLWERIIIGRGLSAYISLWLREDGEIVYNLSYDAETKTRPYPLLEQDGETLEAILRTLRQL